MAAAEVRAEGVKSWADTGEERVPVLRGCSLAAAGGLTAIVGPSGAGKTSLLYCMSGLDAPDEGRVLVAGRDLYAMGEAARTRFLRQAAAFVFQSYNLVPYLTVEENATLPIALARGRVDRERLRDLLGRFGLADRAKMPASGLSGGEQQRAALVRALLSRPAVLFADEPTGALDTRNTALVLGVLREMADAGTTVVMVTHDVDAAATADRVAFVRDGLVTRMAGRCTPEQVLAGTREGAVGRG